MGGAYPLATDDATAVAWNPAALINVKRFTLPIEVVGRVNFDVRDVTDLVDDLEAIRDQTDVADPHQVINAIQSAFRRVQDFARWRPNLSASLSPCRDFIRQLCIGCLSQCSWWILTVVAPIGGVGGLPNPNLYVRGGAIVLTNVGLSQQA